MSITDSMVDVHWLAQRLHEASVVVLDATAVLPAPEFDGDYRLESGLAKWREAHIPGSRHADLVADFSDHAAATHFTHLAPQVLAELLGGYGIDDTSDIVLYDTGGGIWAARLWWQLRAIGVAATVLDGGLDAWRAAGLPVEQGDAPERAARAASGFAVAEVESWADIQGDAPERPQPPSGIAVAVVEAWADIDDVAAISSGDAPGTLVCALGRDQFDGTAPTRYSRRGHIPNSVNVPARSLATDGALDSLLDAPGPVVLYCGGGISAALLALELVRAGRDDVRIFDGSLEEWTADPAREVTS